MSQRTWCLVAFFSTWAWTQNISYQQARPLHEVVKSQKQPVNTQTLQIPMITWGGDVATIYADSIGLFKDEGLKVQLVVENNFTLQVQNCIEGKTPFIRGTLGMVNAAAETFKKNGLELVVIYQLTWSNGGDAMVVRKVSRPSALKNKTVALQLYGPHMDYAANLLNAAKVPLSSVTFKWLPELTLPTSDTGGKVVDPVTAFLEDKQLDAVMCIIPDALNLTSGGTEGTGASGSVKGAKILVSTKTASRVIADVYAVRSDYFEKNRDQVEKFTHALMNGQEKLAELHANKKQRQSDYQQLMSRSADLLLGAPQAIPDVEALISDCEFVGFDGNVAFFTGKGTTRSFERVNNEIQGGFKSMGLMTANVTLQNAKWNYANLAKGLSNASRIPDKPKFDTQKVTSKVEQKISVEPTTWAEEGTLFQIEINFDPNQSDFSDSRYAADFQKALEISETYGGSLIIVEGHSDPLGILKAKQGGRSSVEVAQMEQQAKNLSLERSQSVRTSFLKYCNKKGMKIDESQFVSVGMGIAAPKFNPPRTKDEWAANRRVVFRIKQIEAELDEFVPLD